MAWTLAQAKEHLEEIVERAANDEPQLLQVGQAQLVIMKQSRLSEPPPRRRRDMKELLATLPILDEDLDLERNPLPSRDVEL